MEVVLGEAARRRVKSRAIRRRACRQLVRDCLSATAPLKGTPPMAEFGFPASAA